MSNHTKGKAEAVRKEEIHGFKVTTAFVWYEVLVGDELIYDGEGLYDPTPEGEAELSANANLIAEAFNAANDTGRTPKQLADERAELLAALVECELFIRVLGLDSPHAANVANDARTAIAKAKGVMP